MKYGLVISREYKPLSNGSITCLENILSIIKRKMVLDIVSYNENNINETITKENKITIYRLYSNSDSLMLYREGLLKRLYKLHDKFNWRKFTKPLFLPAYILSKNKGLLFPKSWSKNAPEQIEKILDISKYNYILAIGAPFENIQIAVQLSQKFNIPLYIIEFDLFAYNPTKNLEDGRQFEEQLAEEMRWYSLSEHIFITKEMEKTVKESMLYQYKHKITSINIPNFLPTKLDEKFLNEKEKINILYAGMFYEDIRNPEKMLEVFSELFKVMPQINLHFMGFGCEDILLSYQNEWPKNIFIHGKKSKIEVMEFMNNSHFLLNVSNKTTTQGPSKIIEYVSTGKPIINFYSIDEDVCEKVLEKYPLAVSLDERLDKTQLAKDLAKFLREQKNVTFDAAELSEEFKEYTPDYVGKQILISMGIS